MTTPASKNTLFPYMPAQEPLSFDARPELNFIFGHQFIRSRRRNGNSGAEEAVKIDLTKCDDASAQAEPTKFVEVNIEDANESSELNEDDLELLKECLNKKAEASSPERAGNEAVRKEGTIWKSECETNEVKEMLSTQNLIFSKIKDLIPQIKLLVSTNEKIVKMNDSAIVRNPESVSDESLLNSAVQCIGRVNFEELEALIKHFEDFEHNPAYKSALHNLTKLLESHPKEKEIQELQGEKDSLQDKLDECEGLLARQGKPNVTRLMQILAYFGRRKELEFGDEYSKTIALKKKVNESLKKLTVVLKDKESLDRSNVELKVKVSEMVLLIEEKEKEIDSLKRCAEELRAKLDELANERDSKIQEQHDKDVEFGDQLKEMKQIFNEMREEKMDKQREIELLKEKNESLERCIEELNRTIKANDGVKRGSEMERTIALAKVIMEKDKNLTQVDLKNDQLLQEAFPENAQSFLDEAGELQGESQILKENKSNLCAVGIQVTVIGSCAERTVEFRKQRESQPSEFKLPKTKQRQDFFQTNAECFNHPGRSTGTGNA